MKKAILIILGLLLASTMYAYAMPQWGTAPAVAITTQFKISEPVTLLLLGTGLFALAGIGRSKMKK